LTPIAPDKLLSVLESLGPALKSIDVRTVAVASPSQEHFHNLVTSIIVSEKTLDEVQNDHRKLPAFRKNEFAIFFQVLPFDYEIFDQILKGEIKFLTRYGRIGIRCRKFDPLNLKVSSIMEWLDGRPIWLLRATDISSEKEREEFWAVVQNQNIEAKRLGYQNILELISKSLRTKVIERQGRDFEILIPPLAKISSSCFIDKRFEVEVLKPVDLKGLQLNLTLKRVKDNTYETIWNDVRIIGEGKSQPKKNFCLMKEVFELDNVRAYDQMDVELIVRDSALTFDKTDKKAPLENVVEPFIKTLNSFCTLEELKTMLLEPEKYGRNPKTIFEIAVAWLLSLAGFLTIYLGSNIKVPKSKNSRKFQDRKFDVLLSASGHPIGCSDIIAYEENERLFLIDCDIGPLDTKKIQKLVDTMNYFKASFDEYKQLRIIPVLFSSKDIKEEDVDVRIVDKWTIKSMFKAVAEGNPELARSKLYY